MQNDGIRNILLSVVWIGRYYILITVLFSLVELILLLINDYQLTMCYEDHLCSNANQDFYNIWGVRSFYIDLIAYASDWSFILLWNYILKSNKPIIQPKRHKDYVCLLSAYISSYLLPIAAHVYQHWYFVNKPVRQISRIMMVVGFFLFTMMMIIVLLSIGGVCYFWKNRTNEPTTDVELETTVDTKN